MLTFPFLAMQVTDGVSWTPSDFAFAGALLGSGGLILELAVRKGRDWTYRLGGAAAALASLLTFWVNGAVGIIGNEADEHNLFFNLVPLIALLGTLAVRARAAGLTRLMVAITIVQAAIAPLIFMNEAGREGIWLRELVFASAIVPAIWLAAAFLFRQAARKQDAR
ncbi:hypothetical protein ACFQPG_06635 [Sphingomonas sp. GCM10030256]|uniref:hypothetical protein n=1 Tax=Sphingomonas sp. GCM10030256 TaxID=3273427 RepID=UPI00361827F6